MTKPTTAKPSIINTFIEKGRAVLSSKVILLILPIATILVTALKTGSRTYYWFIIPAILVPALIYIIGWQRTHNDKKMGLIGYLFPQKIWKHKSSYEDYWIILINSLLMIYILPHLVIHPEIISNMAQSIMSMLPIDQSTDKPGIIALAIFIFATFAAPDFMYYWAHRLHHEIPWLWQFHKVHHSAEVMTPLTLYRIHPVEILITTMFRMFAYSVVSGIFFYMYPNTTGLLTIAGGNIIMVITTCTTANLRHSHFWLSFGPRVEKVIMSPSQHQVHHSKNPKHFDKNYGSDLSLWDWLYGTEFLTNEREELEFGISEKERSGVNNVFDLYIKPFEEAANIIKKNRIKKKKRKASQQSTVVRQNQTSDTPLKTE